MDANGTRFHLLLGRADWTACRCAERVDVPDDAWRARLTDDDAPAEWDEARSEVTLRRRGFRFAATQAALQLSQRRGAASDLYGNWYWIGQGETAIRVRSAGSNAASDFWPAAEPAPPRRPTFEPAAPATPPEPMTLRGLAVTADHYLVVGTVEPPGLLVFDLFAGGSPQHLLWPHPEAIAFAPFDMAAGPEGGLWILDREHRRYWTLDRHFRIALAPPPGVPQAPPAQAFQPCSGAAIRRALPSELPAPVALDAMLTGDPIAIEVTPACDVLILQSPGAGEKSSSIVTIREGRATTFSLEKMRTRIALESRNEFSLVAHDFVLVASGAADAEATLFVSDNRGSQAYALSLPAGGGEPVPMAEYLPMRPSGGRGLARHKDGAYYDYGESWVPLVSQPRARYQDEAALRTPVLDGKEPDCVWHRVLLDACIPPGAAVEIWTRAANEPQLLAATAWSREPKPYLRGNGAELPYAPSPWCGRGRGEGREQGEGTWELLLQSSRGRYLEARVRLSGNERTSPHLRAMRIYYPRFSYLERYLPAVYREDAGSARFLDGFLANLEGIYTGIEDRIAAFQALLDPCSAPRESLGWLASWLGAALDPSWDEERRRLFIRHAMLYYRYRGTTHGLRLALSLAFDERPDEAAFASPERVPERRFGVRIVERYLTRKLPDVLFGDPSQLESPRLASARTWSPSEGGAELARRYARFLGKDETQPEAFPVVAPARTGSEPEAESQADPAKPWAQFAEAVLGFAPWAAAIERQAWQHHLAATYGDLDKLNAAWGTSYRQYTEITMPENRPANARQREDWASHMRNPAPPRTPLERRRWQAFLAARYGPVSALNARYGKSWEAIDLVPLPDRLPADGPALEDWYQFESAVLAYAGAAHRFTVLLPMPTGAAYSPTEPRRRIDLARRVVEIEKPAHTTFDVRLYWAMFRVGEARLGLDTEIAEDAREKLIPQLVLGYGYVGEAHVAPTEAEARADRRIVGRDRIH